LAIEERVLSVELHLYLKGYCWRQSRAKIVAIVKTKMQLVLGKNTLEMREFTEHECMPNFELKFISLENLGKPFAICAITVFLILSSQVFTNLYYPD